MQNLCCPVIGKRHRPKRNAGVCQLDRRILMVQFFSVQKLADFFHICPQYGQIVRKGKGRDNRPNQSQRKNYDRQEGGKFQAAGEPEREAAGQHTNQHRGQDGVVGAHGFLVFSHPVHIVVGVIVYCVRIFFVGTGGLTKRFDYLNPTNVLYNGVCHLLSCFDRALPFDGIILHASRHNSKAHHQRDKGQESHAPVHDEQIHDNHQRHQHICSHFRDQVREGRFHAFYPVNNRRFILAGRSI